MNGPARGPWGRRDAKAVEARIREVVEKLATPLGRRVGSAGHAAARDALVRRLAALGLEPYGDAGFALPYRAYHTDFANLVGLAPGLRRDGAPVVLAAHYDTAGVQPGADDNAAAVAIALEVARRLRGEPAERDVLIALFDAEEPPHFLTDTMGSTVFVARQARGPVHAAIVMDLVGHDVPVPGAEDLLFVTGMESDPDLERTIRALPPDRRLRVVTALTRYVGDMSDYHAFRLARVPYLFLTCARGPHYHLTTDTPDTLSYGKMVAVAEQAERLVRDVAGRALAGPWEGYDTTDTDLTTMRAGMGGLLRRFGVELRSRADIDRLVAVLVGRLGL